MANENLVNLGAPVEDADFIKELDKLASSAPSKSKPDASLSFTKYGKRAESAIAGGVESLASNIFAPETAKSIGRFTGSLFPTSPSDIGQTLGTVAGGSTALIPGIGPAMAPYASYAGGVGGRMLGSLLEDEPNPLGAGVTGAITQAIPSLLKRGAQAGRTMIARGVESKVVKDSLSYLSSLLPEGAPSLSNKVGQLQRQLSKGTRESILDWASNKYNQGIEYITSSFGNTRIYVPSVGGATPTTVSDIIKLIEKKGLGLDQNAVQIGTGQKAKIIDRNELVKEFSEALDSRGLSHIATLYDNIRNQYARVQEVSRLLTSTPTRGLSLKEGKINLSNLQQNFLQHREVGKLRVFKEGEISGLENVLSRGSGNLVGVDRPLDLGAIVSLGLMRRGGPGIMTAGRPTLPHAAGVTYQPPGLTSRATIPTLIPRLMGGDEEE